MEVLEAIKGRRSIRSFTDRPVEAEVLDALLEAAIWAPSGGNGQTWRFVVITRLKMLKKIKMVSPGLLGHPPAVIVIAQDMTLARHKGGTMGPETIVKMDTAMAAQNIMLAAYSRGLGSCAVASFNGLALSRLLKLPESVSPLLMVSLGYADGQPVPPPRKTEGVFLREVNGG